MNILEKIDITSHDTRNPSLNSEDYYLCKIGDNWYFGQFNMQWYGWNFDGWHSGAGLQFDPPGTNCSDWQHVFKVDLSVIDSYKAN